MTGFFLFVVNGKTAWQEPYPIANIKTAQNQVSSYKSTRTTNLVVNGEWVDVAEEFFGRMLGLEWDFTISTGNYVQFVYIDRSKSLTIPLIKYTFWNTCPAFILDATFEKLSDSLVGVKLVQRVGPCGKPLS